MTGKSAAKFTAEERAAMRARARELKAQELKADGQKAVIDALAAMSEPDQTMGKRIHSIITTTAPQLSSRTWYGMPAYALETGIICFFKPAEKFGERFATLGFTDKARLDDGAMWPKEYALAKLSPAEEKKIAELVKRAVS